TVTKLRTGRTVFVGFGTAGAGAWACATAERTTRREATRDQTTVRDLIASSLPCALQLIGMPRIIHLPNEPIRPFLSGVGVADNNSRAVGGEHQTAGGQ